MSFNVLLIRTDGKRKVPLGIRVWQKAVSRKSCWRKSDRKFWLEVYRGAKRNRLFEGVKIGKVFSHRFGRQVGNLKRVRHQILLIKDGRKFLMTNEFSLTSRAVKRLYRIRQQVEETFRLLKQEFGWGKCRAQK